MIMSHQGGWVSIWGFPALAAPLPCQVWCSFNAELHFRELEHGGRRGSTPINIWGALVSAAVYLTQHAPGPPRRARRRGAERVTPSLTPHVISPALQDSWLLHPDLRPPRTFLYSTPLSLLSGYHFLSSETLCTINSFQWGFILMGHDSVLFLCHIWLPSDPTQRPVCPLQSKDRKGLSPVSLAAPMCCTSLLSSQTEFRSSWSFNHSLLWWYARFIWFPETKYGCRLAAVRDHTLF